MWSSYTKEVSLMKLFALICCAVLSALAQTGVYDATAVHQQRNGSMLHLSGEVVIETSAMRIEAESADFDTESRKILASGNVLVTLKSNRDGDIQLTANHQEKTPSLFRLSGAVTIETAAMKLQAETVDLNPDTKPVTTAGEIRIQIK
jgi:lipopolysaccharide assembly outer membrane protein LptD (OstA)